MPFYTPRQEHEYKPSENDIAVSVIASFSKSGHMIPLWFQYKDDKIKIDKVLNHYCYDLSCERFYCSIITDGIQQYVELNYHKGLKLWMLRR